ncbi:hypothetical protein [Bacillus sp. EB600]|uniref:hypothetical protein n=1 Tax=Bacillus sp. EB600 TaxID=2806345 RepID=UPI00210AFBE5|nr:hypothetical protein [Bacillus sp. EB600]MCQ6279271.1 hypothetical protein [Bacillus sp. EB600]
MTKEEVVKLMVLIESVYTNCTFKDETVLNWFQCCSKMDYKKVMAKLKNHIRKSPFPPAIADIAVFCFEENVFQETLQNWKKEGRERIEGNHSNANRNAIPDWLLEYSTKKSV